MKAQCGTSKGQRRCESVCLCVLGRFTTRVAQRGHRKVGGATLEKTQPTSGKLCHVEIADAVNVIDDIDWLTLCFLSTRCY